MGISFERSSTVDDDEAVLQFYDANGKKVAAGAAQAVVQFLSNDPNRPDATAAPADDATVKAVKSAPEDKAVKSPAATK